MTLTVSGVLVYRQCLNRGLSDVFLLSMRLWTFGNTAELSCLSHISMRECCMIFTRHHGGVYLRPFAYGSGRQVSAL